MRSAAPLLIGGLLLAGCTRVVDAPALPGVPAAPIPAGQVRDLLSEKAMTGDDGDLFRTVEPDNCSGVVREVDPPFIGDRNPVATDGGHWEEDSPKRMLVEEMVGVYRADYDARAALAEVRRTLDACRNSTLTVTSLEGDVNVFRMGPPVDSGSPDILLWSVTESTWACDYAFTTAHNAAIEISLCGPVNGFPAQPIAEAARERIETLANATA
jgi:hypothetical protein